MGKITLSKIPNIITMAIAGGFVIVTLGGEVVTYVESNYDDIRNKFVTEGTTQTEQTDVIEIDNTVVQVVETENTEAIEETITETEEEVIQETIEEVEPEPEPEPEPVEIISSELLDLGYEFQNVDFEGLKEINSDVCGWIKIDGTNINYPMVNATDESNDYYLHHDVNGKESSSGTIYVDTRCNTLDDKMFNLNDITLIYGHHMRYGKMFANLCNYTKQSYYDQHQFGIIYTPDGYAYKVSFFAGIINPGTSDEHIFKRSLADEEKYEDFVNYLIENSTFESDVDITYGDKIVGLVTCEYTQGKNSRYVLFGKLEKQYINDLQISNNMEEENMLNR